MKALNQKIDALEIKLKDFIQKWKEVVDRNDLLHNENEQLKEKLAKVTNKKEENRAVSAERKTIDQKHIQKIQSDLDQYITQLDQCIEHIKTRMNG